MGRLSFYNNGGVQGAGDISFHSAFWSHDNGGAVSPQGFPGQYADRETGLYYNWHRYYDPNTGRYITSDPVGLVGGINTYAYVDGNPLKYIDFYGLTKQQVSEALGLASRTQTDLDVPRKVNIAYFFDGVDTAVTNPITNSITLSNYYLGDLDCKGMKSLVKTIIHESIHRTKGRLDMITRPFRHPDIYDDAQRRVNLLEEEINKLCKKECGEEL